MVCFLYLIFSSAHQVFTRTLVDLELKNHQLPHSLFHHLSENLHHIATRATVQKKLWNVFWSMMVGERGEDDEADEGGGNKVRNCSKNP